MASTDALRIPGFTITAGRHAAGSAIPRHHHAGATLCLARHGAFREFTRGHSFTCYPSSLKVTPAGEDHWNRFDLGDSQGLMIEVDGWRAEALRPYSAVLDERLQLRGGEAVAVAHRIHGEFLVRDAAAPLAMEGLLLELLATLARRDDAPRRGRQPPWLRQARDIVHSGYAAPLSLTGVARLVDVHPVSLARGFRAAYGETVGGCIRRLRVEHAATALRSTSSPLSEVALLAGFADQAHFSNVFRRHVGMSPSRYRAAVRDAGARDGARDEAAARPPTP